MYLFPQAPSLLEKFSWGRKASEVLLRASLGQPIPPRCCPRAEDIRRPWSHALTQHLAARAEGRPQRQVSSVAARQEKAGGLPLLLADKGRGFLFRFQTMNLTLLGKCSFPPAEASWPGCVYSDSDCFSVFASLVSLPHHRLTQKAPKHDSVNSTICFFFAMSQGIQDAGAVSQIQI